MANEATINSGLLIQNSPLDYMSRPTSFTGNVAGLKGPVPGAMAVAVAPGTDVDLSELTTPAYCRIMNLDPTNYIEYGIWDPETYMFYPLGEVLAGESYVIRLSRNLKQEYGTGTGTIGASTNTLRLRADTAACDALVEAFEV